MQDPESGRIWKQIWFHVAATSTKPPFISGHQNSLSSPKDHLFSGAPRHNFLLRIYGTPSTVLNIPLPWLKLRTELCKLDAYGLVATIVQKSFSSTSNKPHLMQSHLLSRWQDPETNREGFTFCSILGFSNTWTWITRMRNIIPMIFFNFQKYEDFPRMTEKRMIFFSNSNWELVEIYNTVGCKRWSALCYFIVNCSIHRSHFWGYFIAIWGTYGETGPAPIAIL